MSTDELYPKSEIPVHERLTERLAHWNDFFERSGREDGIDEAESAAAELNELWRSSGLEAQECLVSGFAAKVVEVREPVLMNGAPEDVSLRPVKVLSTYGDISNAPGTSRGFAAGDIFGEGRVRLYHVFETHDDQGVEQSLIVLADADFKAVHMPSFELPFVDSRATEELEDSDRVNATVQEHSYDLIALMRSETLQELERKDQVRIIDSRLKWAEWDSDIQNATVALWADWAYVPGQNPRTGAPEDRLIDINGNLIRGSCTGLTIPHYQAFSQFYTGISASAKRSGLSARILLAEDSPKFPCSMANGGKVTIGPGDVISVPLLHQHLQATFRAKI